MFEQSFSHAHSTPVMVFDREPIGGIYGFTRLEHSYPRPASIGQTHNEEERVRETHHRVKNNLQMIASMLSMQAREEVPAAKEALSLAASRIMAVAKLHEHLQGGDDYAVEAADYLEELCGALALGAGCEQRGITLTVSTVPAELAGGQATAVGLIVTELVTNALKHAFETRQGQVQVVLGEEAGVFLLTVADNGVGLANEARKGLGLQLVEQMARKLDGKLWIESSPAGAVFNLRFPRLIADAPASV